MGFRSTKKGATAPNIYDVAKLARVSTATVSAVVNGQDKVEAKTRRRVQAAISKLRYQPNLYASNLARGRTRLLGLIVSDVVNPFFSEIAQWIRQEAQARNYEIAISSTQFSRADLVAAVRRMIGLRVAGLAIMTTERSEQAVHLLRQYRLPAIFEDVGTVGNAISNVRIDYEGGIFRAVKYLVDLGHRKILFIRSYPTVTSEGTHFLSIRLRTEAFERAVLQFKPEGVQAFTVTCPGPGPKAGFRAMGEALDRYPLTAAIAIADPVALGALRQLQLRGYSVPRDVSLIGFDNSYLCEYLTPSLTSVNIPRDKLGRLVVEHLIRQVEEQAPGAALPLETELIVRESVTRPPAKPVRVPLSSKGVSSKRQAGDRPQ